MSSRVLYFYVKDYDEEDENEMSATVYSTKIENEKLETPPKDYTLYMSLPYYGTDDEYKYLLECIELPYIYLSCLALAKKRSAIYPLLLREAEARRILARKQESGFNPSHLHTKYFTYSLLSANPNMNLTSDAARLRTEYLAHNIGINDSIVINMICDMVAWDESRKNTVLIESGLMWSDKKVEVSDDMKNQPCGCNSMPCGCCVNSASCCDCCPMPQYQPVWFNYGNRYIPVMDGDVCLGWVVVSHSPVLVDTSYNVYYPAYRY